MIEPSTPIAAASEGLATPKIMSPITRNTTNPKGSTYLTVAMTFSERGGGVTSYAGAMEG
jgi:hypothetical protein